MSDAAATLLPIYAFMLIPVWIPIIAIVTGRLLEVVKPRHDHPAVVRLRGRRREVQQAAPSAQTV
jgi:hypothetical protein